MEMGSPTLPQHALMLLKHVSRRDPFADIRPILRTPEGHAYKPRRTISPNERDLYARFSRLIWVLRQWLCNYLKIALWFWPQAYPKEVWQREHNRYALCSRTGDDGTKKERGSTIRTWRGGNLRYIRMLWNVFFKRCAPIVKLVRLTFLLTIVSTNTTNITSTRTTNTHFKYA